MATELPKWRFSKCTSGLSPQRRRAGRKFLPNTKVPLYFYLFFDEEIAPVDRGNLRRDTGDRPCDLCERTGMRPIAGLLSI